MTTHTPNPDSQPSRELKPCPYLHEEHHDMIMSVDEDYIRLMKLHKGLEKENVKLRQRVGELEK